MTLSDVRTLLLGLLPPGNDSWLALSAASDPWKVLDGAAQVFLDRLFAALDGVEADADVQTLTLTGIGAWEAALGLASKRIALAGTPVQRLAQILGRLREFGTPTPANVQAALVPICGYTPTIIEHSRATLTALHTYSLANLTVIGSGIGTLSTGTVTIAENAPASKAGAQVVLTITHATPGDLNCTLVGPDSTAASWQAPFGTAALTGAPVVLYAPEFAGAAIDGGWRFQIENFGSNAGTISAGIFVEGIGRAASGAEGLGARIFEWSAFIDETLAGSAYDRATAIRAVERWTAAHTWGGVALAQTGHIQGALCGDPNCIAGLVVCG